jgi:hypothetical protein
MKLLCVANGELAAVENQTQLLGVEVHGHGQNQRIATELEKEEP